jgi:hypothetical protein
MFILQFLFNRFKEPSTWAGAFLVAQAYGISFTPEQVTALGAFGMAIMGAPDDSIEKLKSRYTKAKK